MNKLHILRQSLATTPLTQISHSLPIQVLDSYLEVQKSANFELAIENRCKTLAKSIQRTSHKEVQLLIIISIATFQQMIGVKNKIDLIGLSSLSDLIIDKYPHETYQDIIVALKNSITDGKNFYNSFSPQSVFEILNNYFEQKYHVIEITQKKEEQTEEEKAKEIAAVIESYKKMAAGEWKPIQNITDKKEQEIKKFKEAQIRYAVEMASLAPIQENEYNDND